MGAIEVSQPKDIAIDLYEPAEFNAVPDQPEDLIITVFAQPVIGVPGMVANFGQFPIRIDITISNEPHSAMA